MSFVHVDLSGARNVVPSTQIVAAALIEGTHGTCENRVGKTVNATARWQLKRGARVIRTRSIRVSFCSPKEVTTFFNVSRPQLRSRLTVCFAIVGSTHGRTPNVCSPVIKVG